LGRARAEIQQERKENEDERGGQRDESREQTKQIWTESRKEKRACMAEMAGMMVMVLVIVVMLAIVTMMMMVIVMVMVMVMVMVIVMVMLTTSLGWRRWRRSSKRHRTTDPGV
jgi:Flp pilus assembly protein TadB